MLRELTFAIDASSWPNKTPPIELSARVGTMHVNVAVALLATALRTRQPHVFGLQLADFWAWLRYFPAVDSTPDLRLKAAWADIDPHQKTILSDDWGMGFCTSVITDLLGVGIWANTIHVVDLLGPATVTLSRTGKRGPSKSPDFIGLTADWRFVVLECKGTQTKTATLTDQLLAGVAQKATARFANAATLRERLVGGLFVPGHGWNEEAALVVCDPEPPPDVYEINAATDDIAAAICQSELATVLPLAGLVRTGEFLETTPLAVKARLPVECVAELESALADASDFVGATRTFPLRAEIMESTAGLARAVRASVKVDRVVLEALRTERSVSAAAHWLARRAAERISDPAWPRAVVVDGVGGDVGDAAPPSSTLVTASGLLASVDWLGAL